MNKNSKKFTIQISEEGINIINQALECYSRLGLYQFKYVFEFLPDFARLTWDEQTKICDNLKEELGVEHKNYGIYHPEVKKFETAYQIKQELQKFVALDKTGGIKDRYSNIFDGALYRYEFLPVFLDEKGNKIEHKKEFDIPAETQKELKKLADKKEYGKMWELIDKIVKFDGIKGTKSSISDDFTKVVIYEPYKTS